MTILSCKDWWKKNVTSCDVHRLAVSFWSCVAFVGLGVGLIVFGTTLLDLAEKYQVQIGIIALMYLVRAVGTVVGTVGAGVVMDWLPRLSYTLLCFIIICAMATTVAVPLSVHIGMLAVVMFLSGVCFGALDNGITAVLMRMWGDQSGPCMQFLHFAFAFGAFIAPLISGPFIRDTPTNDRTNHSLVANFSCANASLIDSTPCNQTDLPDCPMLPMCAFLVAEACNSSAGGSVYIQFTANDAGNCSIHSTSPTSMNLQFGWIYWIAASFLIVPLLAFIYFAVRHDTCRTKKQKGVSDAASKMSKYGQELVDKKIDANSSLKPDDSNGEEDTGKTISPKTYQLPSYIILFLFLLIYVGINESFGSLVFTYAVKSELRFSKAKAAAVTAVFWGPFAFARLFSVILAVLKIPTSVMMAMNLTGSLVAVALFLILPHNSIVIWIVSGGLGASFASIFPTAMTWLSENLSVSGKATAVAVAGGNLGDILIPAAVGALIGYVNPQAFVYCTFSMVVISAILITILFGLAFVYKRRHLESAPDDKKGYKKL